MRLTDEANYEVIRLPKNKNANRSIAVNKKAFHDYFVEETYEAGIELTGTEVKSLREGKANIKEAWCAIENGELFIKGMHIKLWDYSRNRGNILGIICPQFSFYWWLLSAVYYFLIHPRILEWLYWFTSHIEFSFVVGFFYGVLCVDLCYSLKVMTRIRHFARENQIIVQLTEIQRNIRLKNEENREKLHFWLSMKSEKLPLHELVRQIFDNLGKK